MRKNQRDPNPVEKILKPTPFSKGKENSRTGYFFTLYSKANPEKPQEYIWLKICSRFGGSFFVICFKGSRGSKSSKGYTS